MAANGTDELEREYLSHFLRLAETALSPGGTEHSPEPDAYISSAPREITDEVNELLTRGAEQKVDFVRNALNSATKQIDVASRTCAKSEPCHRTLHAARRLVHAALDELNTAGLLLHLCRAVERQNRI